MHMLQIRNIYIYMYIYIQICNIFTYIHLLMCIFIYIYIYIYMKCIPDIYPGLCNINPENSQALLETNLPTSYMVSEKGISYMLYVCYSCQHLGHLWGMNIWVPRALSHSCTNVGSGTFEHPSKLPGCFICQALTNTLEW